MLIVMLDFSLVIDYLTLTSNQLTHETIMDERFVL